MVYNNDAAIERAESVSLDPESYNFHYLQGKHICQCGECGFDLFENEQVYEVTDLDSEYFKDVFFCSDTCCIAYVKEFISDNCIKQITL